MRKLLAPASLALAAVVVLAACSKEKAPEPAAKLTGVMVSAMDTHANPCQDFYQYACGTWMAHNPIPADQATWGTFSQLADHNQQVLRTILDQASAEPAAAAASDPVTREVGTFYAACMDENAINAAGAQPLAPALKAIDALTSKAQLGAEVARLQVAGTDALFNFGSTQDPGNAMANVIAGATQGGLSLPDRSYYLKTDAKSKALLEQYVGTVRTLFTLLGDTGATASAEAGTVLRIETALAKASMTRVAMRDPHATYHKMSLAQFEALAPSFDWKGYLAASSAPAIATVNVAQPGFFRAFNTELRRVSLPDWKTYLRWHLVHAAAPALSKPFVDANFAFFGTALSGQQAQKPRWKRCVTATDGNLGFALGQLYVKVAFSPQAKAHMTAMVQQLESALGRDIQGLDWMTPATKQQAMLKLHAIVNKVGYPDKWRDYSSIHLARTTYYANLASSAAFEWQRDMNKIGKPVDRSEWGMTPPTVNAYYTPLWNQIVFPAGILQPPFFSPTRDDATNYGAVGLVMGHEMTHGFDDQGRQYDAQGNLHDWWTAADAKAFQERAACLVREYSGFSPVPGVHLNGKLTLGENTADNGGARVAYMAMQTALAGKPDPKLDGFTRDQRFFLGYAQLWCQNVRPQYARLAATVDPHSPGRFRVNGVVQNMPEFAAAFHCGPGEPMTAGPKACRVW